MKQIEVNPRLVGWSGDWCFSLLPQSKESPEYVVPRDFGDLLDADPYQPLTVASFDQFDEGKWFTVRDGRLVCEPHTPNGYPETLERAEGASV